MVREFAIRLALLGFVFVFSSNLHAVEPATSPPAVSAPAAPEPTPAPTAPSPSQSPITNCVPLLTKHSNESGFDPMKLPSFDYETFWSKDQMKLFDFWSDYPESELLGNAAFSLARKQVRFAWALDADSQRIHYLDGTLESVNLDSRSITIKDGAGKVFIVDLVPPMGQQLLIYVRKDNNPRDRVLAISSLEEKSPVAEASQSEAAESVEKILREEAAAIANDFHKKDEYDTIAKKIDWYMKWTAHKERASVIKDATQVYYITGQVKFLNSQAVAYQLARFFENFEIAYYMYTLFPKELEKYKALLSKTPGDASLQEKIDLFESKIAESKTTLVEHYVEYTWLRKALYGMAAGFGHCSPACQAATQEVLEQIGVDGKMRIRYPDLTREMPRPSLQQIYHLFDQDESMFRAKLDYDLRVERTSFFFSWAGWQVVAAGLDKFADQIPTTFGKTWFRKLLYFISDVRIRKEHLPKLYRIFFGRDRYMSAEETTQLQLQELREISAADPEILVTCARLSEAREFWGAIKKLITTKDTEFYDENFLAEMTDAEKKAQTLGRISAMEEPSRVSMVAKAIGAWGGLFWTGHAAAVDVLPAVVTHVQNVLHAMGH